MEKKLQRDLTTVFLIHSTGDMMSHKNDRDMELEVVISFVLNLCPLDLVHGEKCHFQHDMDAREQSMRGVGFDFLNKGKCERGPDCNFKHSLEEEGEGYTHRRCGSESASAKRLILFHHPRQRLCRIYLI